MALTIKKFSKAKSLYKICVDNQCVAYIQGRDIKLARCCHFSSYVAMYKITMKNSV